MQENEPPALEQRRSTGKLTPDEREAWSSLYRIYERYAPQLREAALLEDGNDKASKLYKSAAEALSQAYNQPSLITKRLSMPLYEVFDEIFKEARAKRGSTITGNGL